MAFNWVPKAVSCVTYAYTALKSLSICLRTIAWPTSEPFAKHHHLADIRTMKQTVVTACVVLLLAAFMSVDAVERRKLFNYLIWFSLIIVKLLNVHIPLCLYVCQDVFVWTHLHRHCPFVTKWHACAFRI